MDELETSAQLAMFTVDQPVTVARRCSSSVEISTYEIQIPTLWAGESFRIVFEGFRKK